MVGVAGLDVARDVDQVPADLLRVDHVRRLDDGRQRHPPVGDVQVVVGADAPGRPEQEADDAEVAEPVCMGVLLELRGQDTRRLWRRECAEDEVERPVPALDDEARRGATGLCDLVDTGPDVDLGAELAQPALDRVDQRRVAAFEGAHDLGAALVARLRHPLRARPDVGRGDVVVAAVELRVQERLPELLDDSAAAEPPQPLDERRAVELVVILDELAPGDEGRQPSALEGLEQREGQELFRRGHGEEPSVAVEAHLRGLEAELVAQAELLGQAEHAVVRRQVDVVEAIDRAPLEVERAHQASQVRRTLVDGDLHPGLGEPKSRGHSQDPAPDDPDCGGSHAAIGSRAMRWRAMRRQ